MLRSSADSTRGSFQSSAVAWAPLGAQPGVLIDQQLRACQRIGRQPDNDGQRRPCLRFARDAGGAGLFRGNRASNENRHRIDIVGRRWLDRLIAGYCDDAQRMAAQIIEINDPSVCALCIELRHRRRLRPVSGATHRRRRRYAHAGSR